MILCTHCGERLEDLHCPECDRPAPPSSPPAPLSRLGRAALLAATELGGVDERSLPLAGRIVRADDEELPS